MMFSHQTQKNQPVGGSDLSENAVISWLRTQEAFYVTAGVSVTGGTTGGTAGPTGQRWRLWGTWNTQQ